MKQENNKNENGRQQFDARIHRLGITSTLVVWCFFLLVPAAICVIFGLKIDLAATAKAAAPIMLIFAITGSALLRMLVFTSVREAVHGSHHRSWSCISGLLHRKHPEYEASGRLKRHEDHGMRGRK